MANKIEILVEVDPSGRGAAAIRNVGVNIDNLGSKTRQAGAAGREALDGFAGGLGVPLSIAGATAAIGAGVITVGNAAKDASLAAASAAKVLESDAKSAGIELSRVRAEARAFGNDMVVSGKEADVSFARFLRIVKAAGETDNLTLYRKRFQDLAAAYALTSSEIETLTSQLLSGQDEALNRLGIADPSQLYDRYAAKVGKTVEALTEEEKARARLLAVVEKGATFEGEAEKRRETSIGQWALLSKTIDDATASLGDYITKSAAGSAIPGFLADIIKNPSQLIAAQFTLPNTFGEKLRERLFVQADEAQQARNKARLDAANAEKARQEAILNPGAGLKAAQEKAAKDEATAFAASFEKTLKDTKLDPVTALFAERDFNRLSAFMSPEELKKVRDGLTKFWADYSKTAIDALKTAREAAEDNFSRIAEIAGGDNNPYVKVITDAHNRAEELADQFAVLGDKAIAEMQRVEASYTRQKLLALDLDQTLKANALRREADALANFTGATAAERRGLGILDKQIEAANSIPELLAKATSIAQGITKLQEGQVDEEGKRRDPNSPLKFELGVDQAKINTEIFNQLVGLRGGEFGGGQRAEDRINQALVDFFNGLAPEMQARIAQGLEGAFQQRTFADAFTGSAEAQRRAIDEEIAKARVADQAASSIREDIAAIEAARRAGLDSRAADARLLATSGALSPDELTADIRQARIEALRREADAEANERQKANDAIAEATAATNTLVSSIEELNAQIKDPKNRRLLIDVTGRVNARSEMLGGL